MDESLLPPGFRFHPTDEELITYYLANKLSNVSFTCKAIAVVDLNKCEPWDLPDKASLMGDKEWYFFSLKDRKYPTGLRTNRATEAGYWKTTGKDKEISRAGHRRNIVGMKKTLVFYKGRAPTGEKTNWVIHEYRLENPHYSFRTTKEEWVVCRVFRKTAKTMKPNSLTSSLESSPSENPNLSMPGPEFGNQELPNPYPHIFLPNPNPNFPNSTQHVFPNSSNFVDGADGNNLINGINVDWMTQEVPSWRNGGLVSAASNTALRSLIILKALQLKSAYDQQQQRIMQGEAAATTTSGYNSLFLQPQIIGEVGESSSVSTPVATDLGMGFHAPLPSTSSSKPKDVVDHDQIFDGVWSSHLMDDL